MNERIDNIAIRYLNLCNIAQRATFDPKGYSWPVALAKLPSLPLATLSENLIRLADHLYDPQTSAALKRLISQLPPADDSDVLLARWLTPAYAPGTAVSDYIFDKVYAARMRTTPNGDFTLPLPTHLHECAGESRWIDMSMRSSISNLQLRPFEIESVLFPLRCGIDKVTRLYRETLEKITGVTPPDDHDFGLQKQARTLLQGFFDQCGRGWSYLDSDDDKLYLTDTLGVVPPEPKLDSTQHYTDLEETPPQQPAVYDVFCREHAHFISAAEKTPEDHFYLLSELVGTFAPNTKRHFESVFAGYAPPQSATAAEGCIAYTLVALTTIPPFPDTDAFWESFDLDPKILEDARNLLVAQQEKHPHEAAEAIWQNTPYGRIFNAYLEYRLTSDSVPESALEGTLALKEALSNLAEGKTVLGIDLSELQAALSNAANASSVAIDNGGGGHVSSAHIRRGRDALWGP